MIAVVGTLLALRASGTDECVRPYTIAKRPTPLGLCNSRDFFYFAGDFHGVRVAFTMLVGLVFEWCD
jgi:hypothetical protein